MKNIVQNTTMIAILMFIVNCNEKKDKFLEGALLGVIAATPSSASTASPQVLVAANYGNNSVQSYTINAQTGALNAVSTLTGSFNQPTDVALLPNPTTADSKAYVTNFSGTGTTGSITPLAINLTTGVATVGTSITTNVGSEPYAIAFDPTGRFFYSANAASASSTVNACNVAANTCVAGVASGVQPKSIAIHPTGRYVYVANYSASTVIGFQVTALGAATLTAGAGTTTVGSNPSALVFHPNGKFLYVVNAGLGTSTSTGNISVFAITDTAATSLSLTAITGSPFSTGGSRPISMAITGDGRFAYVLNYQSNTVTAMEINQSTGGLSVIGSETTGTNPVKVVVSRSGKFVFVANKGSNTISVYQANSGTGKLSSSYTTSATDGVLREPYSIAVY